MPLGLQLLLYASSLKIDNSETGDDNLLGFGWVYFLISALPLPVSQLWLVCQLRIIILKLNCKYLATNGRMTLAYWVWTKLWVMVLLCGRFYISLIHPLCSPLGSNYFLKQLEKKIILYILKISRADLRISKCFSASQTLLIQAHDMYCI